MFLVNRKVKATQLYLFEAMKDECMALRIEYLQMKMEKYRKSQFAKIGELKKMVDETKNELEILKAMIYQASTLIQ